VIVWKSLSGRDSLSAASGQARSLDVRALLDRFWPRAPNRPLDGGSDDPQMDALRRNLWAVLTGIAFVLAGAAIVSGVLDVLAARLLGLMLLVFSALALAPLIFSSPRDHASWGANAYNLTAVGACVDRRRVARHPATASPE